jgi:DNA polymerase elongation subunit (family B)
MTNFKREPVIKLSFSTSAELTKAYKEIREFTETYEADVRPHMQFLMDHNIKGSLEIESNSEQDKDGLRKVDRIFHNPKIKAGRLITKIKSRLNRH